MKRFRKSQQQRHHGERHGAEVDHADDKIVVVNQLLLTLHVTKIRMIKLLVVGSIRNCGCMWDGSSERDRRTHPVAMGLFHKHRGRYITEASRRHQSIPIDKCMA